MGLRLAAHVAGKLGGAIPVIGYTLADAATRPDIAGVTMLRASQLRSSRSAGTEFHLESPFGASLVKTHLVGHFNISNALGVMGALLAKGMNLRAAIDAIEALQPAPGRMQQVGGHDAPMIVIDYAHTPDALEKTLAALRPVAQERGGQLWCVFGCGGDRDPGKRPADGRHRADGRPRRRHQATIRAAKTRTPSSNRSSPAWTPRILSVGAANDRRPRRRHPVGHQARRQAGRDPAGR